ncbi:MAG: VOC family protein [Phenylobacterium sp.]|nr:VOC family protein [Phenylobacterium sp.]
MLSLDHVVFPVRDAAATLGFYRDLLGLPLTGQTSGEDWDGYRYLMMFFGLGGGTELVCVALLGAPAPPVDVRPKDARHYAFCAESAEAYAGWKRRLADADVASREERHGEQTSLYFEDPDGIVLEITWPPTRSPDGEDPQAVGEVMRWLAGA